MRILALIFLAALTAGTAPVQAASTELCETNTEIGNPGGADMTICHQGYAVGYSFEKKIPLWCAYWIDPAVVDINVDRADRFKEHPQVPAGFSSTGGDYSRSGYDRGHCAPSASIDYSRAANDETFFYTNMFPQRPGFNRDMMGHKGVWGYLENEERKWSRSRGPLYVISGAYAEEGAATIGAGVVVPTHFFKIVVNPRGPQVLAFWMPHEEDTKFAVSSYLVSVDFIESKTGLDFLSLIEDQQEESIEVQRASALWK